MAVSNELLNQFVKSTKQKTQKTKQETFVRGTMKRQNGKWYVKIDGSSDDSLTPALITTNVNANKPVTVMLKNHTATVIGNVSNDATASENANIINPTSNSFEFIDENTIRSLWTIYNDTKN